MTNYRPTPMHPTCCAACGAPMLHTAAPHVKLCYRCTEQIEASR